MVAREEADGSLPPPFGKHITYFSSFLLHLRITFLFKVFRFCFSSYILDRDRKNKKGANYLWLVYKRIQKLALGMTTTLNVKKA